MAGTDISGAGLDDPRTGDEMKKQKKVEHETVEIYRVEAFTVEGDRPVGFWYFTSKDEVDEVLLDPRLLGCGEPVNAVLYGNREVRLTPEGVVSILGRWGNHPS